MEHSRTLAYALELPGSMPPGVSTPSVGARHDLDTAHLLRAMKVVRDAAHNNIGRRRAQPPKGYRPDPQAPPHPRPDRDPPYRRPLPPPLPFCKLFPFDKRCSPLSVEQCFRTVERRSPALPGQYPAGFLEFDRPDFGFEDQRGHFTLKGVMYYPGVQAGSGVAVHSAFHLKGERAPIVVLAHGGHPAWMSSRVSNPSECPDLGITSEQCTATSQAAPPGEVPDGFQPLPSYRGYDYLQAILATHGIASVSLDFNLIDKKPSGEPHINRRFKVVLGAIRFLRFLAEADPQFRGRLDPSKLGMFGHSRGAGAVIDAAEVLARGGDGIKALLALAPWKEGIHFSQIAGSYPLLSMFGSEDNDIPEETNEFLGAQLYDLTLPAPIKFQAYLRGCNHESFNRYWTHKQAGPSRPSTVLPDEVHQSILAAFASAYFRLLLKDETRLLGYLIGSETSEDVPQGVVELSCVSRLGSVTVDDFEQSGLETNSLGGVNAFSGSVVGEYVVTAGPIVPYEEGEVYVPPSNAAARGLDGAPFQIGQSPFDGRTKGLILSNGTFRAAWSEAKNVLASEIWLRAAIVPVFNAATMRWEDLLRPIRKRAFQVGVEDEQGRVSWSTSDAVGRVEPAHERRLANRRRDFLYRRRAILKTFRFPAVCFESGSADLSSVVAIHIRTMSDAGTFVFDDIQLVRPARLWTPEGALIERGIG